MSLVKPISLGQVVESITGRDCHTIYLVVGVQGRYVFVSDGRERLILKPKKKNIRHVRVLNHISGLVSNKLENGEKVTNEEIRGVLNIWEKDNL